MRRSISLAGMGQTAASADASNTRVLPGALALVALLGALIVGPVLYLPSFGQRADARVADKQERFALTEGGWWRHELEITYKYRAADAASDMTVSDLVDESTFDALRVGDTVAVLYSPIAFLRYAHPYGSKIERASTWSRFFPSTDDVTTMDLVLAGLAIALAVVAYRTNQALIVGAATAAVATVCSAVVLLGPFVLALLFGMWFATRRATFGWGLVAALFLTPQLLWVRIPHPPSAVSGAAQHASGRVRDVRTVPAVWPGYDTSGERLPQPFDIADVVFTPPGSARGVHIVDRVDTGTVPLRRGETVSLVYPIDAPERGRLAAGERSYDRRFFTYVMEITYGGAATLAFVVAPAWLLLARWFRRLPIVRRVVEAPTPARDDERDDEH